MRFRSQSQPRITMPEITALTRDDETLINNAASGTMAMYFIWVTNYQPQASVTEACTLHFPDDLDLQCTEQ